MLSVHLADVEEEASCLTSIKWNTFLVNVLVIRLPGVMAVTKGRDGIQF